MRRLITLLTLLYSVTLSAQERITLLFVGDLMQHQAQIDAARVNKDTYDYTPCFAHVKEQISQADLAIGNLEVPFGGKPYTGYPAFCAPDEYLYAIKEAGFNVLLTANNHCIDRGKKGLERTILLLDSLQIPYAGTYRSAEERQSRYPLFIHKKGFRIALLNYTYGTNGITATTPNVVNYIDRKTILQDIHISKSWKPDVIIACMHWGDEYRSLPNREQRQLADWLLEQGVTHIIGSHPHVIQPMEMRTDSLTGSKHAVVYSLGNFISNMSQEHTDGGAIFTLVLEKDVTSTTSRVQVKHCGYNLVWTGRPALTGEKNFILYPTNESATSHLPVNARNRLNVFIKNSHKLLQQHNIGIKENKEMTSF